ncbi:MAG: hypothetical protein LBR98_10320 [Syntrophomonadaceae bacterium]|nr:hypothetical protein [Syntrophomonadaceae bacterium]
MKARYLLPGFILTFMIMVLIVIFGFPAAVGADDGGDVLPGFLSGIDFGVVTDFIVGLIVPDESYWSGKFDMLKATLYERIPYSYYLEIISKLSLIDAADVQLLNFDKYADVNGVEYDFQFSRWLGGYVPYVRGIITFIVVVFMAYYNIRQILYLIRGSGYESNNKG